MVMAPPVQQESSIMPVDKVKDEKMDLEEEEKNLLCKSKRPKVSGSTVQPQQEIEVPAMQNENKGPAVHSLEVSGHLVQSIGDANGCNKELAHDGPSKELRARSKLSELCRAIGWKDPTSQFEEQGPPHIRLFTCKMTLLVSTITDTLVECCSDPKPQKKAAQEQAAQGICWCLERLGHAI